MLSGVLSGRVGDHTVRFRAGEPAVFPAGVPHRWWNDGDEPLTFKDRVVRAGDLDRFLEAVFAVANAAPAGQPSVFSMAHVLHCHRNTQMLALVPRWIQRVILPLIVSIGRLLGKYRGNS